MYDLTIMKSFFASYLTILQTQGMSDVAAILYINKAPMECVTLIESRERGIFIISEWVYEKHAGKRAEQILHASSQAQVDMITTKSLMNGLNYFKDTYYAKLLSTV